MKAQGVDAWLLASFRHNNPIAISVIDIKLEEKQTRRCFYLIPAEGEPVQLMHKIEMEQFPHLPGSVRSYAGWREMEAHLKEMVSPYKKVAMEYSPGNAIPYVSLIDAGTIEMIRGFGPEVISSATLVQEFESTWTDEEYASHDRAAQCLYDCVKATYKEIARRVQEDGKTTEHEIQDFMMEFFASRGMETAYPPCVAVNANSANPHYGPSKEHPVEIKEGDFVLTDLWCKEKDTPRAMYGDITWVGYVGEEVPERHTEIFNIVAAARDAGTQAVTDAFAEGREITGAEVDDAVRKVIEDAGYGEYFIHRTGHSIGEEVHGNGANIDNLETRDERLVIKRTCFSIEPGIYLPGEFGVRCEIDVYVHPDGRVEVTGQSQQTEVAAMYNM